MLDMLHTQSADTLPVALGGGWYGYTDRRNTAGGGRGDGCRAD
jgi:hypothetical protein